MFVLKSCCCCSTLRNGTNIIAILTLIGHVLNIGQRARYLAVDVILKDDWIHENWWWRFTIAASIIDIIFSLIMIVFTSMLLRGVQFNKRQWVDLWVKAAIVIMVVNGIISGIDGYYQLEAQAAEELGLQVTMSPVFTGIYCAILLIAFSISFYLWLVVYSFSVQLREQEERRLNPGYSFAPGKTTDNHQMV